MPNIPHSKSAKIVLRVKPGRKGAYVLEARRRKTTLIGFIQAECDRASNYQDSGKLRGDECNPDINP